MIVVHRLKGGKIVEDWLLVESVGFYQQLGLLPDTREIFARGATGDDVSENSLSRATKDDAAGKTCPARRKA